MNNFMRLAYLTVAAAIAFAIAIAGIASENVFSFTAGIGLLILTWLLIVAKPTQKD